MDAVTLTPNLGELCPGQDVVLTCSTTEGDKMNWFYNGMEIMNSIFIGIINPIGDSRTVEVSGFMFSLE